MVYDLRLAAYKLVPVTIKLLKNYSVNYWLMNGMKKVCRSITLQ